MAKKESGLVTPLEGAGDAMKLDQFESLDQATKQEYESAFTEFREMLERPPLKSAIEALSSARGDYRERTKALANLDREIDYLKQQIGSFWDRMKLKAIPDTAALVLDGFESILKNPYARNPMDSLMYKKHQISELKEDKKKRGDLVREKDASLEEVEKRADALYKTIRGESLEESLSSATRRLAEVERKILGSAENE